MREVLSVILAAAAFTAVALTSRAAYPQTDGSSAPALISCTAGSLFTLSGDGQSGGDQGRARGAVQVWPRDEWTHWHHATPVCGEYSNSFRHYRHVHGPDACLFTGRLTDDGHIIDFGGGRDCPRNDGDDRCGAIGRGWRVFALAGGSCESFGVPACGGLLPCY